MIDRLKDWAAAEPARVREVVRALVILGAVVVGVAADSEMITSVVTVVTMLISVLLQEGVRKNVTPVDSDTGQPYNPDYHKMSPVEFTTEGDSNGVY